MIELHAGDLVAAFAPEASLVCASLEQAGHELLGQRGGLEAWRAKGKTFGIPLLHPWANRLGAWSYDGVELPRDSPFIRPDEHGMPIHGLLHGATTWDVLTARADRLTARYDFGADACRLPLFPFPHVLEVDAVLDPAGLTHRTRLVATGEVAVPVAFGWHPYLVLPGVPRADWELRCSLGGVADGPLGDRTFDDGFGGAAGSACALEGGGRRVGVTFLDGYTHAQLFAPPGEDLVAFEPMTAPAGALRTGEGLRHVAPGDVFEAAFRVDVA